MNDKNQLQGRVLDVFNETFKYVSPDPDMDLFEEAGMDSLMFITLLTALEQEFDIEIPLEQLELDDFRTVANIAGVIANYQGGQTDDCEVISFSAASAGGKGTS